MSRAPMIVALVVLMGLAASPAAGAPFASSTQSTTVSAYGGTAVWSAYEQSSKRYFLTARVNGRTSRLPLRPRTVPFDVELGPGPNGGVVAVYSRCRQNPDYILPGGSLPQPNYSRGRGCDIWRYSFATGKESKVAPVSGPDTSEYMPSIWKNTIAFARVYERRHGRAAAVTWVYTRDLSGPGPSIRRKAGPWGYFDVNGALQLPHNAGGAGVMGMDLAPGKLALAWEFWPAVAGPGTAGDPEYDILLDLFDKHAQISLAQISTPESINNALFGPSILGDTVYFGGFSPDRTPTDFIVRYSIANRTREYATVEPNLVSHASTGSATFTVRRSGGFLLDEYRGLTYTKGFPPFSGL